MDDESGLRHLAWIEDNRRKVDQATGGRVAYVHMPDTGFGGYTSFMRYFFAQVDKEAVIIDERFNHGGALATDIIEYLQRKLMSVVTTRDGADLLQPQGAIFGPKVMIVNEFAGSGGDAMPWYFHRAGVGKLIGERTWGGLVGLTGYPELMDGGVVMAPSFGGLESERNHGRGEPRHGAGYRSAARPGGGAAGSRSATRKGDRGGDAGTAGQSAAGVQAAGVSELSEEVSVS